MTLASGAFRPSFVTSQESEMKQVPPKDLPDVAGGEYHRDGCIPDPFRKLPYPDTEYPQDPMIPTGEPSIGV